ncbi:C4-dicarboxylate anaerobic carrier [Cardiobacterium valvarum F0432]|uniref:C4-dicarboxylate anaerobic carrier n=1 Tax=Cardiobacterium valvarum F0432 TaxID=797473 RepID=G9ZIG1_9GAMM|nr:C4-dicarboxylate anaerobic carrier [Cardiobacterium valvarum F0432]
MLANTPEVPVKKKFKMPDIYIVLVIFILVVAVLTYIVPAGQYERETIQTAHGTQTMVVKDTYHTIEQHPVGFMDIVTAIPDGLKRAAGIVFLTFMVGGCMGLIKRAGLIDMGVRNLNRAVGDKGYLVIPILISVFTGLAAFIGVPELSLAYLPVLLPLFYRLGYDGMTATAVSLLGPCMGFTFGLTIPGSVGVGQQIAQLPIFSGSGMRALVLLAVLVITIIYVMRYAAKVKADPQKSLTLDTDHAMREAIAAEDAAKGEMIFSKRQKYAGIACFIMFPIAIAMILIKNLGFEAIGGLFLLIGIAAAAIAGKRPQEICGRRQRRYARHDGGCAALRCRQRHRRRHGQRHDYRHHRLLAGKRDPLRAAGSHRHHHLLGTVAVQLPHPRGNSTHCSHHADPLAAGRTAQH